MATSSCVGDISQHCSRQWIGSRPRLHRHRCATGMVAFVYIQHPEQHPQHNDRFNKCWYQCQGVLSCCCCCCCCLANERGASCVPGAFMEPLGRRRMEWRLERWVSEKGHRNILTFTLWAVVLFLLRMWYQYLAFHGSRYKYQDNMSTLWVIDTLILIVRRDAAHCDTTNRMWFVV